MWPPYSHPASDGREAGANRRLHLDPTGRCDRGRTYTVTADGGGSGNPVTFATTTGGLCTVAGSTVAFTHAGTCTITAEQTGNTDYAAAPTATQSVPVGKGSQTVTFTSPPPANAVVGGSYQPTATGGGSGHSVTFSIETASSTAGACSIDTTTATVSFTGTGTCILNANQNGDTNHTPATQVQQSITVSPARVTVPGAPTDLVATAGDGSVTVAFTLPTSIGGAPITGYTVTATGGGSTKTATGTTSSITVTGLTNGTTYTLTVTAANSAGHGPASAIATATPVAAVSVHIYGVSGTATPPSGSASPIGPGSLTATVGSAGFADGTLTLPDIDIPNYPLFGVLPTSVHARVVPAGPVTGTITNGTLTVTSSVNLVIGQVSVFGLPLLTPGSVCQTVTPSTVTLTGSADVLQSGGTLSGGSYTAAKFSGCGFLGFFLEPLLNANVSAIPNAITATLAKPLVTAAP